MSPKGLILGVSSKLRHAQIYDIMSPQGLILSQQENDYPGNSRG